MFRAFGAGGGRQGNRSLEHRSKDLDTDLQTRDDLRIAGAKLQRGIADQATSPARCSCASCDIENSIDEPRNSLARVAEISDERLEMSADGLEI